jgi:type I restriction enzyme S subunit
VFPLPPLAEQHRIVAKVDELMALCDRLERLQEDSVRTHASLVETLLGALTAASERGAFAAAWQRIASHFDTLFTTESSIDQLKQTILQLAVMGKLVDEGSTWNESALEDVAAEIVDCPHSTPKWTDEGEICVRTNQFKAGCLDLSDSRFVSEETYKERIQRLTPKSGDILYSREGGILGIACSVPPDTKLCLGQRMMLIRAGENLASEFLELVLNSPLITEIARRKTTGGAAPRVNVSTVKAYPIPLPPLAEQHRIVAKVDELVALCDLLKARLQSAQATKVHIADTLVEAAIR